MKKFRGVALSSLALAGSTLWATTAHAYRPFDGTDADVAEPGVVQLDVGVGRLRQGMQRSVQVPTVVASFGVEGDTEIGIGGRVDRPLGDTAGATRTSLSDTELAVKHLFRKGSLQEGGSGVSIAGECTA